MADPLDDAYSRLTDALTDSMRPAPRAPGHSVVATGDKDPVTNAQEYFRALKDGKWAVMINPGDMCPPFATEDPDLILIALRNSLAAAGKGPSALDPSKTDEEMEEEIRRAAKSDYIRIAREDFTSLSHYYKEYKPIEEPYESLRVFKEYSLGDRVAKGLESTEPEMRWMLKQAGVDASALDPTGTKSAVQMEQEITQATKQGLAAEARTNFSLALTSDDPVLISSFLQYTRDNLAEAGLDASVLDPEGKKSAKEMDETLAKMTKDADIGWAREQYGWLQRDIAELPGLHGVDADVRKGLMEMERGNIQKTLDKAGVGAEVLKGAVAFSYPKPSNDVVVRMFGNPDAVDKVAKAFNEAGYDRKLSAADQEILRKDPRLAETVFGEGGIKELIGKGLTTISELHGKPTELLDTIRNPRVRNAIEEGITSVSALAEVPPQELDNAQRQLFEREYESAARALHLNASQTQRFVASANRTDEAIMKPGLHPDLHANDFLPFMQSAAESTMKR